MRMWSMQFLRGWGNAYALMVKKKKLRALVGKDKE